MTQDRQSAVEQCDRDAAADILDCPRRSRQDSRKDKAVNKRYKQTKDNLDFAMYVAMIALMFSVGVPVVIMWAGAQ